MRAVLTLFFTVFAIIPLLYILTPLVHLFYDISWQDVLGLLQNAEVTNAVQTTFAASAVTTALSALFGLPAAFILSHCRFPGRRLVQAAFVLPLVLPPIVGGIAQLSTYGPETGFGLWFGVHGIRLTDSFIGVILAQTFITSPFMVLGAMAGFEEIPRELQETTRLLGGGMWDQFWSVALPLNKQAIFIGTVLTFTRAVGEFGATAMMAYHPYTVPVELWVQFSSGGLATLEPIAAAVCLLAFIPVCLWALIRRGAQYAPVPKA